MLLQKYHLYDPSRPLRPWLYRIAVNTSRNLLRRKTWIQLLAGVPIEGKRALRRELRSA
ncbi:sigma factor [Paenibacillus rhizoplanae]